MNDPLSDQLEESIAEVTDLKKFDESSGFVCTSGPKCPYCGRLVSPQFCGRSGLGECQHCGAHFHWSAGDSPVGFSWTTWKIWKREERPQ